MLPFSCGMCFITIAATVRFILLKARIQFCLLCVTAGPPCPSSLGLAGTLCHWFSVSDGTAGWQTSSTLPSGVVQDGEEKGVAVT